MVEPEVDKMQSGARVRAGGSLGLPLTSSQLAMADSTSAFLQSGESNYLYGAVDRYK
jgi:hypothetical protein